MKPGDIIFWRDEKFGHHRFWQIESVHIGAENRESLVEIRSLTEQPGRSCADVQHPTTFVPEPLLRDVTIYTPDIRSRA